MYRPHWVHVKIKQKDKEGWSHWYEVEEMAVFDAMLTTKKKRVTSWLGLLSFVWKLPF